MSIWERTNPLDERDDSVFEYEEVTREEFWRRTRFDPAYDAIQMLTDAGLTQVNIHAFMAEETFDRVMSIIDDVAHDPRLAKLRAVVALSHKPKGRNSDKFHALRDTAQWRKFIAHCNDLGVSFGMDSCSAPMILKAYEGTPDYDRVAPMIEPCEAGLFSSYINTYGQYFPCSFTEGEDGWETGLDVLSCEDFVKDIWEHPRTLGFRYNLLATTSGCKECPSQSSCRACPTFNITRCHQEQTV